MTTCYNCQESMKSKIFPKGKWIDTGRKKVFASRIDYCEDCGAIMWYPVENHSKEG